MKSFSVINFVTSKIGSLLLGKAPTKHEMATSSNPIKRQSAESISFFDNRSLDDIVDFMESVTDLIEAVQVDKPIEKIRQLSSTMCLKAQRCGFALEPNKNQRWKLVIEEALNLNNRVQHEPLAEKQEQTAMVESINKLINSASAVIWA